MVDVKCKNCGEPFQARVADRKRGWGKFCSKSCKASEQEKRTRQYHDYRGSGVNRKTYRDQQREHGGVPQFNRRGDYEGFQFAGPQPWDDHK